MEGDSFFGDLVQDKILFSFSESFVQKTLNNQTVAVMLQAIHSCYAKIQESFYFSSVQEVVLNLRRKDLSFKEKLKNNLKSKFWFEHFTKRQILNHNFYSEPILTLEELQRAWLWIWNFSTCQVLNLKKSTCWILKWNFFDMSVFELKKYNTLDLATKTLDVSDFGEKLAFKKLRFGFFTPWKHIFCNFRTLLKSLIFN